ncbi:MAG: AarF/UbiB family protein [Thermoanaerobacteraceae bacterium]|nr:AarF/UbiB family protein [Thermoanaerobacteraceae bacterium]
MDIFKIHVNKRNVLRFSSIIDTFIKYGLYELVDKLTYRIIPRNGIERKVPFEVRVRQCFQELGPTFIKFGQLLSTRTDIIPEKLADELSHLQDKVEPFETAVAYHIFKEEIGLSVEDVFVRFDEVPLASASIGQVYNAVLKDGSKVIVKIQRPDVEEIINSDLDILFAIARFLDKRDEDRPISYTEVVEEISRGIRGELDYHQEGRNAERFKELFKDDTSVYIPEIYWNYTSRRVLTMEKIVGIPVKDIEKIKDEGYDIKKIAKLGAFSFMKQVFIFGYFHGDPHPSNILVLSDERIALIDFGVVGRLDRHLMRFVRTLFMSFIYQDVDMVLEGLEEIHAVDSNTDYLGFSRELYQMFDELYINPLENVNMEEILRSFMNIIYKYYVHLPADFTLLVKTLITIEGVGRKLDPEFKLSEAASQFLRENLKYIYDYRSMIKEGFDSIKDSVGNIARMPTHISRVLRRLENNDLDLKIRFIETQKIRDDINYASNKLSLSVLVAALSIASAMFMQIDMRPYIFGMPFIGFLTFCITVILGLWLLFSVIFHRPG